MINKVKESKQKILNPQYYIFVEYFLYSVHEKLKMYNVSNRHIDKKYQKTLITYVLKKLQKEYELNNIYFNINKKLINNLTDYFNGVFFEKEKDNSGDLIKDVVLKYLPLSFLRNQTDIDKRKEFIKDIQLSFVNS